MQNRVEVIDKIRKEICEDDYEVRDRFLVAFKQEVEDFAQLMADAFLSWQSLDEKIGSNEKLGHVSAFVYSALTLHILSMKLFLSGHIVAAGNLMRQVVESMAMALLCSSPTLGVLDKFMRGHFSTQKAVDLVNKHYKKLGLKKEGLEDIKRTQIFYHGYSHPSRFTFASHMSFETVGALYVGSSFDEGKMDGYKKEVGGRLGLGKVFCNFIEAVSCNLSLSPPTSACTGRRGPCRP